MNTVMIPILAIPGFNRYLLIGWHRTILLDYLLVLGNVLGDTAIGITCLLVSVPGMALGLVIMMLKVKETKGVDMGAIRGDEFEN